MSARLEIRLALVVALALAGACGDDSSPVKEELDNVGGEEEPTDGEGADDDAVPTDGDDDDSTPTPAPKDTGTTPPKKTTDAGPQAGPMDAGAKDPAPAGGDGGVTPPAEAGAVSMGAGACCSDGNCLCHGPAPTALTAENGPYKTMNYTVSGVGCVYYPTDAEPPYAAVAVSDGFTGTGGCGSFQTGRWGPLYASWGIVTMIINTGSGDQPNVRGRKLTAGIAAFKAENEKSGSPLQGKLSGRYGTSGFSMGGGGTTYSSQADKTLKSSVAIMPWGPVRSGVEVPTLVICGSSDGTAPCGSHGTPAYNGIADTVPKMRIQISSGHAGQPTSGGGTAGKVGLAFQKVFLEGDERWRPFLVGAMSQATNIK